MRLIVLFASAALLFPLLAIPARIVQLAAVGALAGGGWLAWSPGDPLNCGCIANQPEPTVKCIEWLEEVPDRLDTCLARRDQRQRSLGLMDGKF